MCFWGLELHNAPRWYILSASLMARLRGCCSQLLVCLSVVAVAPIAWAFNARIDRPTVETTLAPGQASHGTIQVENQGSSPVTLDVYLQDWEYLEGGSGDKLFSPPGSSAWSAAPWVSYFPSELTLPAHGKGVVEYTIRVPADARGGRYAVLFFESILGRTPANADGVSVQYTGRLGSLFEIAVAGTVQRSGDIADLTVGRPDEDRALALGYAFRNTGNVAIRPKAYVNIVDAAGQYFGRGEFPQLYTFPGRSGASTTEWTGSLPPGDYTVLVTVDVGEAEPLVAERPLRVAHALAIEAVAVSGHGPRTATLRVHNAGHFREQVQGTLELLSATGQALASWTVPAATLAPDERRELPVSGGAVPAGAARCHVRLTSRSGLTADELLPCSAE